MGKAKKLTGVPWHVEPAKDVYERKRRTWCGYYDQETGKCKLFCELCHTNTACSHYWVYKKPNNDDIDKTNICKPFNGVQEIDMEDMMINEKKRSRQKKIMTEFFIITKIMSTIFSTRYRSFVKMGSIY